MKISEIRSWLEPRGLRLTRGLGQNFLHDTHQLDRIVKMAEVQGGDRVLEIGPGLGALTERLLEAGADVLAVEKDIRLAACLRQRLGERRELQIVEGDALDYLREEGRGWEGWKMVSNLPYSAASPILVEFGLMKSGPACLVATVQQEVADRLLAGPGSSDYGILTVFVQLAYEAKAAFSIPATCFFPAPDVESACVRMDRRTIPLLETSEIAGVVRVVKRAFSQRRKMMWKLLRSDWSEPALAEAYERLGLNREVRAERVGVEVFVELARDLQRSRG